METLLTALNEQEHGYQAAELACDIAVCREYKVPEWFHVLPLGDINGRDGRKFVNDSPATIVASFTANKADLPVDYEHATEKKPPLGEKAEAIGWVKELQARNDGVWARVEWTEEGARSVSSGGYRYVSPVILYTASSRKIVAIKSVGLTNQPNLFLNALNSAEPTKGKKMDKELLEALGLPENATKEQVLAALNSMKVETATAKAEAAKTASNSQQNLEKYVPRADYDTLAQRVQTAETALNSMQAAKTAAEAAAHEQAVNSAITAALTAKKIAPATEQYHRANCSTKEGLERFKAFAAVAPVVVADQQVPAGQPAAANSQLSADEKAICENLGISEADYLKGM